MLSVYPAQAQDGACCYCDGCVVVTAEECEALGGTYLGDGAACTALCSEPVFMPDPNLRAAVEAARRALDQAGG